MHVAISIRSVEELKLIKDENHPTITYPILPVSLRDNVLQFKHT